MSTTDAKRGKRVEQMRKERNLEHDSSVANTGKYTYCSLLCVGTMHSALIMLGIGTRPVFDVDIPTLFEAEAHGEVGRV
jgi:hypothetical protein